MDTAVRQFSSLVAVVFCHYNKNNDYSGAISNSVYTPFHVQITQILFDLLE